MCLTTFTSEGATTSTFMFKRKPSILKWDAGFLLGYVQFELHNATTGKTLVFNHNNENLKCSSYADCATIPYKLLSQKINLPTKNYILLKFVTVERR
jgi:hypothetical protein